ncbi:MAG: hypothetical protein Q7U38_06415 [Methylobacter sp.]|nr:hypothetical protein [Methylobacter sp.]MDP2097999.1 hypothetical protein [Methylobacter sp.]MDZ4217452.1 hypothetical protein [Methylobacter sp.]
MTSCRSCGGLPTANPPYSVIDKLDRLQSALVYSTNLAEAIGVSRRTLLNWRQKPESISAKCRLNIDVLYCRHFLIPEWDDPTQRFEAVLLPDDMPLTTKRCFCRFYAV